MTNLLLGAASVAGLVAVSAPAFADDAPASPWAVSASIDVQSDYKFRGISQNKRDPSPQGTVNITGPEGFYVGSWASTIDWSLAGLNNNPGVEWDIYGGKHTDLWGVDWNIEPYYYAYPDANTVGGPKASYFELINQFTNLDIQGTTSNQQVFQVKMEDVYIPLQVEKEEKKTK